MFFDEFLYWCNNAGVSPSRAAIESGLHESAPSAWKQKGVTPSLRTLTRLAEYFGITVDELLDHTKSMPANMVEEMQDELFEKRKLLFDLSKNATEQDLDKFIKMLEIMIGRNDS